MKKLIQRFRKIRREHLNAEHQATRVELGYPPLKQASIREAFRRVFTGTRLYGAYCLLRGDSVMYGMRIRRGTVDLDRRGWVVNNKFDSVDVNLSSQNPY